MVPGKAQADFGRIGAEFPGFFWRPRIAQVGPCGADGRGGQRIRRAGQDAGLGQVGSGGARLAMMAGLRRLGQRLDYRGAPTRVTPHAAYARAASMAARLTQDDGGTRKRQLDLESLLNVGSSLGFATTATPSA